MTATTDRVKWEQWADDDGKLYIVGTTLSEEGVSRGVVAVYHDGQWEDISRVVLPESVAAVEMAVIAMWTEMPPPDLSLRKD